MVRQGIHSEVDFLKALIDIVITYIDGHIAINKP